MKRGNFLKLIATMVVAPTLMGDVEIKPHRPELSPQNIEGDRIRIYTDMANKCRLNDLIVSDMGDRAVIISLHFIDKPCVEARPVMKGKYRYKSLEEFQLFGRMASVIKRNKLID